jgi:CubicO group peptidase (beta-lactamase class C family)
MQTLQGKEESFVDEQRVRDLESFYFERMSEERLPGLAYALIEDGEVTRRNALGYRDMHDHLPVTLRTIFGIGSVTKVFTAVAIMQLREKGLLELDDPVEKHVPLPPMPFDEPVRVWHLLSHSSGLPGLGEAEARHSPRWFKSGFPIAHAEDLLAFMEGAGDWVHYRPGERWFYSNEGYLLLGVIIERLSGQGYGDYVTEHILAPLGMDRSFFLRHEVEEDDDRAIPYIIDRDDSYAVGMNLYRGLPAAGGLVTSVEDLARFTQLFVSEGRSPEGTSIFNEESLRLMREPRIPLPGTTLCGPTSGDESDDFTGEASGAYGCGPQVHPGFFGHELVGHSGGVMGASAYMGVLPERRLGAVVVTNANNAPANQLALAGLATLLGKDLDRLPSVRRERLLDSLCGPYDAHRGSMDVRISRDGMLLELVIRYHYQDRRIPLVPVSLDEQRPRFDALINGRRVAAEFIRSDRGLDVIFDRYTFRKR